VISWCHATDFSLKGVCVFTVIGPSSDFQNTFQITQSFHIQESPQDPPVPNFPKSVVQACLNRCPCGDSHHECGTV